MKRSRSMIALPIVAAAIAVPAAAQAAPASDVAVSMARFAQQTAGEDAEERASDKRARYLAHKDAGTAVECEDCSECAPCEACRECDQNTGDQDKNGASRHA